MSKFGDSLKAIFNKDFNKTMWSEGWNWLKNSALGRFIRGTADSLSGASLTPAQQQANEFTANEAQKNRDWEEQMSNTAFQRQVADMQSAGVNPALMYGSGASGASTPSGSAGSSVSPSSGVSFSDLIQFITLPKQLKMLDAQIANVKESTRKTGAEISQIDTGIHKMKAEIKGLDISNEQQSVILRYLDRSQRAQLSIQELSADRISADITSIYASIDKMNAEQLATFVSMCKTYEEINTLQSQQSLNDEQGKYYAKLCSNLEKQNKILELQERDWDFINVVGASSWSVHTPLVSSSGSEPVTLHSLKERASNLLSDKKDEKDDKYSYEYWKERMQKEYGIYD